VVTGSPEKTLKTFEIFNICAINCTLKTTDSVCGELLENLVIVGNGDGNILEFVWEIMGSKKQEQSIVLNIYDDADRCVNNKADAEKAHAELEETKKKEKEEKKPEADHAKEEPKATTTEAAAEEKKEEGGKNLPEENSEQRQ
jgi:hypothetical protein